MLDDVEKLISLGKGCQGLDDSDDMFFERVQEYLEVFSNVQESLESQNPDDYSGDERATIKQKLEELVEIHQEISDRSNKLKESLGSEMGDFHKRGRALKHYVDQYPQSISITGKRKG